MNKARYWKLTPSEVENSNYNTNKIVNWDIKCTREPEDQAIFLGVFSYRHGTPFDYEPVKGIVYYHNNIQKNELLEVTKFLKGKFGGKEMEKGSRIFLKNSREIYSGKEISALAKELETRFNTKAIITLEFKDFTEDEQKESGLLDSKLLPIPGN